MTTENPAPALQVVNVFISYASADLVIAKALYNALREVDPNRVICFLDTQSIDAGVNFQAALDDALEKADWLVCIYTGEQSDYCGYEIGVFSKSHESESDLTSSRLVCLHDVPKPLSLIQNNQSYRVTFPAAPAGTPIDEASLYMESPLARFFNNFLKFRNLDTLRDVEDAKRQTQSVIRKVKMVTDAFKAAQECDLKADTPTQLRMEITVVPPAGAKLTKIPDDAVVCGTFESLGLFNLMPPMLHQRLPCTSWAQLREESSASLRRVPPWMQRLERDIMDAASGRRLSGLEATFSSRGKIYRTILSRHQLFENGTQKFEVLFVETLPRQFLGKRNTSLILAGLVLASRFRFAYLEEPEEVAAKFSDALPGDVFESHCWQFHYDLDRLQHEAVELGLLDTNEFVKAFGEANRGFAEGLLKTSVESRARLLGVLPPMGEPIGAEKRPTVRDAILAYLREVGPVNSRFISVAIEVYREEIRAQLAPQLSGAPLMVA
ncbi:MAG: toll/interleukin-1 receptor domain-containing protein [Gammaproteobacteria bacterium]